MSTSSNVVIKEYDERCVVKLPVASATVLAAGDLIVATADTATTLKAAALSAASLYNTFVGVALGGSESGQVENISVATRARIAIKVVSTSGAALVGDAFYYSAGANGTDWQVTKCTSGVSGITWALEAVDAGSSGEFLIDTHVMKSGFKFDAIT